jgi:magnesium-transporting ATPase (P-type)
VKQPFTSPNAIVWYQLGVEQVFDLLATNSNGLTTPEAKARLAKYGYNELKVKKRSPLIRFLQQFHNALLYVLIVAAIVTFFLGHLMDTYVIIGVVLAIAIIGFIQEGKAEASLEALKKMMIPECHVLRDGERKIIAARELVPGDVVLLEGGDRVPADLRLFETKNLSADEAVLTGESIPVDKNVDAIETPNLPPADRRCMAFSGTFITRGQAKGVVVETGKQTEIGKIAGMMVETKRVTPPIVKKVAEFTKFLIITILIFGVIVFAIGLTVGYEWDYMFLAVVSMIVALIPEGLPAALISVFAIGATHMARRNALIRRLPAVESLGCTTVICSDKTGTLTKNEMTVVRIYSGGRDYQMSGVGYEPSGEFFQGGSKVSPAQETRELVETLTAGYLCNNAALEKDENGYSIKGDPTEGALIVSAVKAGIAKDLPRLDAIPFEPEQQYMATLHQAEENIIYVKGSPEKVLGMCRNQLVDGKIGPLESEQILGKAHEMARDALRVLAMAYKYVDRGKTSLNPQDMEGLTFLGLQGMIDPPREEAIEAVRKCKKAGIRSVMITGDHVETARAIARQLEIGQDKDRALTGKELSRMSDEELYGVVDEISVYARVAPEHKLRITKQLQRKGHIVAMTGDGVNDAPALKTADIGIAMGITGTEVSKEASDMVLTDDNFASIVAAVEEGRHIFNNIWKIILYITPTNGGQGLAMGGAVLLSPFIPVFALDLPIQPVQILWVNLIVAIACGIPLVWEPKEQGILDRPPRDPKERLFNPLFLQRVGLVSVMIVVGTFTMFLVFYRAMGSSEEYLAQAQTIAFTTIILMQIAYLFTARTIMTSAFAYYSPLKNKRLLIGCAITIGLQLIIVYSSPLFGVSPFRTEPFPAIWWIPLVLVSTAGFLAVELEKLLRRRFGRIT